MGQIKMQCTVAVGTTNFDELIKALDTTTFHDLLVKAGFTRLIIQYGTGDYEPSFLKESTELQVMAARVVMLENVINKSDLVISHCGAGIVLECLRSTKNEGLEEL